MGKNRVSIILVFSLISAFSSVLRASDLSELSKVNCKNLNQVLNNFGGLKSFYISVPRDWSNEKGSRIPLFVWYKKGEFKYPPLLLLHGGPAANSASFPSKFADLIKKYPGDVVSLDQRGGNSCSADLTGNLPLTSYIHLQATNIVNDLEYLRRYYFSGRKWRAFGQSRGSLVLHMYLNYFPNSLESVHAHGWSLMDSGQASKMTFIRANAYLRTSEAYLKKYPQDRAIVAKIKRSINNQICWPAFEGHTYCGPSVVDIFGYDLGKPTSWDGIHKNLVGTLDANGNVNPTALYNVILKAIKSDGFAWINYIAATFSQESFYPDYASLVALRNFPIYNMPVLSEIRYLSDVIKPSHGIKWRSNSFVPDYAKIKSYLERNPRFNYFLYSGALDSIAPVEIFQHEVSKLGGAVKYNHFLNSGHDGWWSEPLIQQRLLLF